MSSSSGSRSTISAHRGPLRFAIEKGTFGGRGNAEYSPTIAVVDLEEIRVDGLKGDYKYKAKTAQPVKQAATATAEAAKKATNQPDLLLKARRINVNGASLASSTRTPPALPRLHGRHQRRRRELHQPEVRGAWAPCASPASSGSGQTTVTVAMRPENTARFDSTPGSRTSSYQAERSAAGHGEVRRGRRRALRVLGGQGAERPDPGYVKPLFKDLKVYEKEKDADKKFSEKVKAKAIDVASKILKNHPARKWPR